MRAARGSIGSKQRKADVASLALAIILSLSFWGLIWGVAGLFLAVPMTGALLIVCEHVQSLRWLAIALAGPQTRPRK